MSSRKRAIRPRVPALSRKEREINEMTGRRLPQEELKKAAANARYIDGEICFNADGVRILLEHSPLDPATKALRRAQFEASVTKKEGL